MKFDNTPGWLTSKAFDVDESSNIIVFAQDAESSIENRNNLTLNGAQVGIRSGDHDAALCITNHLSIYTSF